MEELAAIAAIAGAIKQIYDGYQAIIGFLGAGDPSPEQIILSQLQQMAGQLKAIQVALDALNKAVLTLIALDQQQYLNRILADIHVQQAYADTASQQLQDWVAGGKTSAETLASAQSNSQLAANTMRDVQEYFECPIILDNGKVKNVFDYRMALIQYVYVLAVRIGVINATDPNWRSKTAILNELQLHADRLTQIITSMDAAIQNQAYGRIDTQNGMYFYQDQCTDTISGYQTDLFRSNWLSGTQADLDAALASLKGGDRADVRSAIGLTAVMQFRDAVNYDAAGRPSYVWTPWFQVVASTGKPPDSFGTTRPVTAISSVPVGVMSLFWVANDGSIHGSSYDTRVTKPQWTIPFQVAGPGSAMINNNICAVGSAPGSVSLFWVAPDGSIQSTYYDERETQPLWIPPFQVAGPGAVQFGKSIAAVSSKPDALSVFWITFDGSIQTTSYVLSKGKEFFPVTIVHSQIAAPFTIVGSKVGSGPPDSLFAVSSAPGSMSLFWVAPDRSIQSTYYDEQETQPFWITPFQVAQPGEAGAGSIAVISSKPDTLNVFWVREPRIGADLSIQTTFYTLSKGKVSFPVSIVHSPPTAPFRVVPSQSGTSWGGAITAVNTAPGSNGPGGISLFWIGDDMSIRSTYTFSSTSPWANWFTIGAPIGSAALLVVSPVVGGIYLFDLVADGTIQSSYYDPVMLIFHPGSPRHLP